MSPTLPSQNAHPRPNRDLGSERSARSARPVRSGATLVEVAIATMMLSVMLVPAIKLVGQSRDRQRQIADENELTWQAENLLDRFRIELKDPARFSLRHSSGFRATYDLESLQMPRARGRVEMEADSTVAGPLITLQVTTWNEENLNRTPDGNETLVQLRTQVSAP